jgi:rhodanese-related sulfurtransferase
MAKSLADLVSAALAEVTEITPDDVNALLERPDRGGYEIIDVREPDEWQAGHLPGARHYPRGFLEVRADLAHPKRDPWLADRSRKLVLYCGGGHRSALAAQTLQQMGFTHVRSMREGWTGWTARKLPSET